MKKLDNWDDSYESEVKVKERVPKGAYIVKITNVVNVEKNNYLKIEFDIVNDPKNPVSTQYAGLFSKRFVEDKKWDYQGVYYASYTEKATDLFNGFITAVVKSNKGFAWNWDESKLVNKFFVAQYGEEESLYNDEVIVLCKCRKPRSIEALRNGEIKELPLKKLKVDAKTTNNTNMFESSDIVIADDDLPF